MIDLHIGVTAAGHELLDSPDFQTVMDTDGHRPTLIDFRDRGLTSWEQWYEEPWEFEDGLEAGSHVVIRCASIASALENLAWIVHEGVELVPMRFKEQANTVAAITSADDWEDCYLNIDLANQGNPTGEPARGFHQPKE